MAKFVIKRDGTKEPFDSQKIRNTVAAAAKRTNLPQEKIDELVEQVSQRVLEATEGKEEVATSEIREEVLNKLDAIEPAVSDAWRKYESEKKDVS